MGRLDTCYRSLATAAANESAPAQQEAYLRTAIAEYFLERAAPDAVAAGTGTAAAAAERLEGEAPAGGVGGGAAAAAGGAEGLPSEGSQLKGLPVKAGNPSLRMDVRELLAFAKRQGTSKGAPEVNPAKPCRSNMENSAAHSTKPWTCLAPPSWWRN